MRDGRATITKVMKRGKLAHQVRAWIDGKREHLGTFLREEDALACKAAHDQEQLEQQRTTALTVDAWIKSWIDELEDDAVRSAADKKRVWEAYVKGTKLGGMALRAVKQEHVREWFHALKRRRATRGRNAEKVVDGVTIPAKKIGESTLHNAISFLSAAFRDAERAGKMRGPNPAHGHHVERAPRTDDSWHYLTLDEIHALFALPALDSGRRRSMGIRAALTTAIYTGLREGELWGLRWEDVHLGEDPHLVVRYSYGGPTKGGIVRRVPLFPPAIEALKAWREHKGVTKLKGLVWPGRKLAGRRGVETHKGRGYDAGWPELRDAAGIRSVVVFHDLRHTYASHLVSGSWGRAWRLEEIQRLLGHAELSTTMRYAHLAPEAIRGAAAEARAMWLTSGSPEPGSPRK